MVNIWATFCGPCISEMPELGELASEYADKGMRVVGLVTDVMDSEGALDEAQLQLARDIVSETGADYLHIVPGEGLYGLLSQVSGVAVEVGGGKVGEYTGGLGGLALAGRGLRGGRGLAAGGKQQAGRRGEYQEFFHVVLLLGRDGTLYMPAPQQSRRAL